MTMKFLLVDDDEIFCSVVQRALTRRGLDSVCCFTAASALDAAATQEFSHALIDLKIAQDSGLALIKTLKTNQSALKIVMLTGYSSVSTAVDAIKLGAINYLCKPADVDSILKVFEETAPSAELAAPETPPSLDRMEWELIQQALAANQGNISATARELGMHRRTLQRKLLKRPTSF